MIAGLRGPAFLVAVLAIGLLLRIAWPLADPPADLSWSGGAYTDPASKTLPARYAAQFGDWHLAESHYLHAFPLANGLTWIAYRALGVGRLSHQILTAIVSTAGLLALFVAVHRGPGRETALLAVALGAVSWWLAMFGRLPVVENLVAALLATSAACALSGGTRALVAAGAIAAAAALLGKYHAAAFLPALATFLFARGYRRPAALLPVTIGAGTVTIVWALVLFLPHREELLAYVHRVSVGVHGALPVTQSPLRFLIDPLLSMRRAWVFHHAPALATIGAFFAVRTVTNADLWRRRVADGSALFALWLLVVWLYFSLLSYKAPRYYITIGPALAACAACQLVIWLRAGKTKVRRASFRSAVAQSPIAIFLGVVLLELLRQLASAVRLAERTRHPSSDTWLFDLLGPIDRAMASEAHHLGWGVVAGLALLAAGAAWTRGRRTRTVPARKIALGLIALAVVGSAARFTSWATHRAYAIEEAKANIASLIAPDSVLLGPLAALLTQDSPLLAISWLDPVGAGPPLLARVTHRVDEAAEGQPPLGAPVPPRLQRAVEIQGWMLRTRFLRSVRLSRVEDAANEITPFERATEAMAAGDWARALQLLDEHRGVVGDRPEISFKEAACRFSLEDADGARIALAEGLRTRPFDPVALQNLGMIAWQDGRDDEARRLWMRALRADPHNPEVLELLRAAR